MWSFLGASEGSVHQIPGPSLQCSLYRDKEESLGRPPDVSECTACSSWDLLEHGGMKS